MNPWVTGRANAGSVGILLICEKDHGHGGTASGGESRSVLRSGCRFSWPFEVFDDYRQRGKVLYPLDEILLLVLLAVLADCDGWVEIARFGEKRLALLRRFRPFKDGTPSHDQLGAIFAALDAEQFQSCFIAWVSKLTGLSAGIIAIDGKTLRRSYQEGGAKAPIHMISAWSCGQNVVLGQAKVDAKSNEITAIPQPLDLLTIKAATVTIDAMGCQREIAAKIIAKEADYVLALKGNQGTLRDDVEEFFFEQKANGYRDRKPCISALRSVLSGASKTVCIG